MVKWKKKRNSEAHWEGMSATFWRFFEFNFKFLISILFSMTSIFNQTQNSGLKNIYLYILPRLNIVDIQQKKLRWNKKIRFSFLPILTYPYFIPRIQSRAEHLGTKTNEDACCRCETKELRMLFMCLLVISH